MVTFKRIILFLLLLLTLSIGTIFMMVTLYKKELAVMLVNNLKTSYGLTLKIEDVNVSFVSNWPNASVQFENIYLVYDLQPNEPLLKARSLSLSFDVKKLFVREFIVNSVALKDAEINLVKNFEGLKNYEFKNKDTTSHHKSTIHFEVSKIRITNTSFNFINKQYDKKIEFVFVDDIIKLNNYSDGLKADLSGDLFIKGLLFKPKKGPFLSNVLAKLKLQASVCFSRKEIFIHQPSYAEIDKQLYNLSAFIELKETKKLALTIEGKNVNYQKAITLLNHGVKQGLSNIKVANPINGKALIMVKIGEQEDPIIIMQVSSKKNNITIGDSKIPYSDVNFEVAVISLDSSLTKGNATHAKVIIKPLKGKVYDFPFTGSVMITNFINPFVDIKANLFVDTKQIKFKPAQEFDLNGSATASISYSGPIKKVNHKQFIDTPMVVNARVKFNQVSCRKKSTPYTYVINGNALVVNNLLKFDDLALKMDGGNVKLKGSVDNFVRYSLGYADGFKAELIASTDYFDLTQYIIKKAKPLKSEVAKTKAKIGEKITVTNEGNFEFEVSLNAKKFLARKIIADDAHIKLHYKNKLLAVRSLKINTCEGKLLASGTIYDLHKIDASFVSDNINVNQLFEQFENFGQEAIESDNIQGKVSLNAKLKMELDDNMEVLGNTIDGEVKFKLKDGHLLNYEPLQKISDYVFRNRNFQDISFTEINETFIISGYKIYIRETEIASNVLNLHMSGIYNFKDYSTINILIPWNNLSKRGKNYIPKSSGKMASDLKGLKLNYSGFPNKMKVGLGHNTP